MILRVLKAAAFWVALVASLSAAIAFACTPDSWIMTDLGCPVAAGHGVATLILPFPSADVDAAGFDYYTPSPLWWSLPSLKRGIDNAVVVVPLVPLLLVASAAAVLLWPFRKRPGLGALTWRAVAVCATTLLVFLGSAFCASALHARSASLPNVGPYVGRIERGAILLEHAQVQAPRQLLTGTIRTGVSVPTVRGEPILLPAIGSSASAKPTAIPLWLPFILALPLTVVAWRRTLSVPRSGCPNCGYDTVGLDRDSLCPECGAKRLPAKRTAGRLTRLLTRRLG